jgi:hypothetical protein
MVPETLKIDLFATNLFDIGLLLAVISTTTKLAELGRH